MMPIQTRPLSHRQEHDNKYAEPPHRVLPQQEPVQEGVLLSSSSDNRSSHRPMGQCLGRLQSARPRLRARSVPTARTAWIIGRCVPVCRRWFDLYHGTDLTPLEQAYRFYCAESAPPHLEFRYPSWATRNACAQEELDPLKMVMGTDGNGDCVYWDASRPERWERSTTVAARPAILPELTFRASPTVSSELPRPSGVASGSRPPSRGSDVDARIAPGGSH